MALAIRMNWAVICAAAPDIGPSATRRCRSGPRRGGVPRSAGAPGAAAGSYRIPSVQRAIFAPGQHRALPVDSGRHSDARLIAGGTDLVVESNLRERRCPTWSALRRLRNCASFPRRASSMRIGAGLTLNEIAMHWSNAPEVFREWLRLFASPLIRNRATLGGNLATASPIGDGAPLLLALDAEVHIASQRGRRIVPLHEFFTSYRHTALAPGRVDRGGRNSQAPAGVHAVLQSCQTAHGRYQHRGGRDGDGLDASGKVARARFAFGGVAAIPMRALSAEEAIVGQPWNEAAVERAQAALDRTLAPISDHRGSAEYRLAVAKSLLAKFLWERREAAA